MFNFDTKFTKGKHSYTIVDNKLIIPEDKNGWSKISASNANALIEHWFPIIQMQVSKAKPSNDFETLITEINYLQDALSEVRRIKAMNCSYNNKNREILEGQTTSTGHSFACKIKEDNFSPPQQLVLRKLSKRSTDIGSYELQELYNPVTDDASKLKAWWKELNSFNFKKYGIDKDNILKGKDSCYDGTYYGQSAYSTYKSVEKTIENFRVIIKEAGDDLINWSDQKISLRFTKLGISCKAWEIRSFVSDYTEHLEKKGIKKVDKKKNTSKGKLEDLVKSDKATQDDLWRYYKQASPYDATKVIDILDLEHLYMIIDSDLKCVKSKLFDKYESPCNDVGFVIGRLCELSVTKQDYKKIIKWATPHHVLESFMIKHKDHSNNTEVEEYCKTHRMSTSLLIDDDFYHTCLTRIPDKIKYNLNQGLTWQYMVRMNDSDKITMLKRITSENESVELDYNTLYGLYHKVDYSLIKDIILEDEYLLQFLALKLVKENDHKAMVKSACEIGDSLDVGQKVSIFKRLTFDEKKEVIKYNYNDGDWANTFTKAVINLTDVENLDLLQSIIEDEKASRYMVSIFRQFKDTKNRKTKKEANKIVKAMVNVDALPLDERVISCLTVDTKADLLIKDKCLRDIQRYYSYSNSVAITSNTLGTLYFEDFKRVDIDKVYDSPIAIEYRKFLAHTMTKNEVERCADSEVKGWLQNTTANSMIDLQESFFRHNIELLGYSYLKQFKEKKAFKAVVGDRRNTENRYFGQKLLDLMNVTNSIDFMFS